MDGADSLVNSGKSDSELLQFKESFETFSKIINNLQRQYLTLEKEYRDQGRRLEDINRQLRHTISANQEVTSFLNSILTSLTTGVLAVDHTGVISHFNPAAESITGVSINKALGRKYDEVIRSASGGRFSALDTIMSGKEFDSEEKVIKNHRGDDIPLSVSTSLLKAENGNNFGAVEIFFDLTKTRKLEAEVHRIKTLAALGEMAATVAHEVRNPLGGIGGFAALLKRELADDDDKIRLVDKIIAGVDTLNRTVVSLLDYTRRDQLNLREVSLERLIQESVDYEKADRGNITGEDRQLPDIRIEVLVGDRNLRVKCDPHLMRQVLLNLLRNSRDAMPAGGRITILADKVARNEETPVPAPAVWIEIEDDGCGIDDDIKDKIFQPFFSTKRKNHGSGLGLASVWKTIQAHGGEIRVDSVQDKGTSFKIYLPMNI